MSAILAIRAGAILAIRAGAILAIDAAGSRAGVAVLDAAGVTQARCVAEAKTGLTEILPQLLETCLGEAGVTPECVAVTIGPGQFYRLCAMRLRWRRVMPPLPGCRYWA